jgi:hypothetical protein
VAPNPFAGETQISYLLPQDSQVSLEVFNLQGQQIRRLQDGFLEAGRYQQTWDGRGAEPGTYIIRLTTGETVLTQRVILLR